MPQQPSDNPSYWCAKSKTGLQLADNRVEISEFMPPVIKQGVPKRAPGKKPSKTTKLIQKIVNVVTRGTRPEDRAKLAHKLAKPMPKVARAVPKVARPVPKVARPMPKVVKPVPKVVKSEPILDNDEEKKAKPQSVNEAAADEAGCAELSPLMTSMLEIELRRIMIKVWQELPDAPPSEAEKLVVTKLRNEAGDELRNILGLNVVKRLLNIHNPLCVKVNLSRKPDPLHLKSLLRTYHCLGMRRLSRHDYSFVTQMRTVAAFDRICGERAVQCGDAVAAITPAYKFGQCPASLKTIYSEKTSKDNKYDKTTNDYDLEMKVEVISEDKLSDIKNDTTVSNNKLEESIVVGKKLTENDAIKPTISVQDKLTAAPAKLPTVTVTPNKLAETSVAATIPVATAVPAKTPTDTVAPVNKSMETVAPVKKPTETVNPAKKPTETVTPAKKLIETVTSAKKPIEPVTSAEKPTEPVTPAKNPMVAVTPPKKPTETVTPAKKPIEPVRSAEKPTEPVTPAKNPMVAVTPPKKPTETVTPAKKPIEPVRSAEKPTEPVTPAKNPMVGVTPAKKPTETVTPAKKPAVTQTPAKKPAETVTAAHKPATVTPFKQPTEAIAPAKNQIVKTVTKLKAEKQIETKSVSPIVQNKASLAKSVPITKAKVVVPKPTVTTKASNVAKIVPKTPIKKDTTNKTIKVTQRPVNTIAKKAALKVAQTKVNKRTKFDKDDSDNDELDDDDILALMSEAIILDECSGSDEE